MSVTLGPVSRSTIEGSRDPWDNAPVTWYEHDAALMSAMLSAWVGQCYRDADKMPDDPAEVLAELDKRISGTSGHNRRAHQIAARQLLARKIEEAKDNKPPCGCPWGWHDKHADCDDTMPCGCASGSCYCDDQVRDAHGATRRIVAGVDHPREGWTY